MTTALPLYRSTDLRRIEAAAADQALMQRAGLAAAGLATTLCAARGAAVLLLAGPGNNGGDAFEAALHLRARFFDVCVVFPGGGDQARRLPPDAASAYQRFIGAGGSTFSRIPEEPRWSLIIDGLFGIGLQREVTGHWAELIEQANALARRDACPLLALDCPSGLDADTGRQRGACIRASHTLTFIAGKPGLYTGDGPDCCGEVAVAPLDLHAAALLPPGGQLVERALFAAHLRPRARNSHKGSHGSAGVLGGARGMVGAAFLAGRAALKLGSGRVYLALLDPQAPVFDPVQAELMLRDPVRLFAAPLTALACGPGMGTDNDAIGWLETACATDLPLLLDADALNLLASEGNLQVSIATRQAPVLLTPHPAEAARLLGSDIVSIQDDRIAAALELASRFNACVALKGCGTVIATADGRWFINATGNPGLASAGTGDVLTGFALALLAQGWPALPALLAAVHLHGAAADKLAAAGQGPIGLSASELPEAARRAFNGWITAPESC